MLCRGLGVLPGADGVRAFAEHYADRRFVGRNEAWAALDRWRDGPARPQLVVAAAGLGKSALLYRWARTQAEDGTAVVWLPISARFGTASPRVVRDLLSARLAALGQPGDGDWVDAADRGAVLVVLDGLDEAHDAGLDEDLRALASRETHVLAAARTLIDRDAAGWRAHLGWSAAETVELGPLSRTAVADLFDDPDTAAHAMQATGGDPLELELRFGAGATSSTMSETAEDDPVLGALAAAVAPIPLELLARVADVAAPAVEAGLRAAGRRVVVNPGGGISFAHPRLGYDVLDRLPSSERHRLNATFASVIREQLIRLRTGAPPDACTPYVLRGARLHLTRASAPLDELDGMLDPWWLDLWSASDDGTSGFFADLFAIWERVDGEQAQSWSDERAAKQFRYAAIAQLLEGCERNIAPAVRADAIRLGVRSQRAAISSLAAITDKWQHAQAVRALLPVLEARAFDRLLATVGSRAEPKWPAAEMMGRLIEDGLEGEALLWLDGREKSAAIAPAAACMPALSDDGRRRAREAVRRGLEGLGDNSAWMSALVRGALALPTAERDRWLAHALTLVANEGDLFWDAYYDEADPRLTLAQGFAAAGATATARELIRRVLALPYPFAEKPAVAGPEVIRALGACASAMDDNALREQAIAMAGDCFAALCGLVEADAVEPSALEPAIAGLRLEDARAIARAADVAGSPSLAQRTLALVRACARDLREYGHGYALHAGLLVALGRLTPHLTETERAEAQALVWHRICAHGAPTVRWWHVGHAILPLLAASPNHEIADAVMARALDELDDTSLCELPRWDEVFAEDDQRAYVRAVLDARVVGRPTDWCGLLTSFAEASPGEAGRRAAQAAVDLACSFREWGEAAAATGQAEAEHWHRVAGLITEAGAAGTSVAWALSTLLKTAPDAAAALSIARAAWTQPASTARMGCAGELLAALPPDEAEPIAAQLLDDDALAFVSPSALPPQARAREVAEQRAALTEGDWPPWIEFLNTHRDLDDVDTSRERDALLTFVRRELLEAADPPEAPAHPAWQVLTAIMMQLDHDEVLSFEPVVLAHGPDELLHTQWRRLRELGDEAGRARMLPRLRASAELSGVTGMSTLLMSAGSLTELEPFLAEHPDYATYPWVIAGVRERGWHVEFATRAHAEPTRARLSIWDQLWEHLNEDARDALRPAVWEALCEDVHRGLGARHRWWPRLDREHRRRLWNLERSAARARGPGPGLRLHVASSLGVGLGDAHAAVLEQVIRWFVPASGQA